MGLVKEPFGVDLYVDPKPLPDKEKKKISDYIKSDKESSKKNKPGSNSGKEN